MNPYRTPDDSILPDPFPPCDHEYRKKTVLVGMTVVDKGRAAVPEWRVMLACVLCGDFKDMPRGSRPPWF